MRINIISAYFSRRRMKKAILKWNSNAEYITQCIEESSDPNDTGFKWTQLVWQEITMWIRLHEQVSQEDFDLIHDGCGSSCDHFESGICLAEGFITVFC